MRRLAFAVCLLALAGCSTYTTPGAGVALGSISEKDADIAEAFRREPAAAFPARLAVVRVASSGYRSAANTSVGAGAFSVVTTRDIETDESFARLGRMSQVAAVAPVTRLLIPTDLSTTRDLRNAAAQLKADALLIYTIDTRFRTDTTPIGPLQTVALGLIANKNAVVDSTCAFLVVDVRTGFVYGTGEVTVKETQRSNPWNSRAAVEEARLKAERKAFEDGLTEMEKLWVTVLAQHATRRTT